MPLAAVEAVLDAGPDEAAQLFDEHVAKVLAATARESGCPCSAVCVSRRTQKRSH